MPTASSPTSSPEPAGTGPLLLVGGPTASGKSRLALALAAAHSGTVICADSMQVYGDLRVLTARPRDDEMALAPHALYGVLDGAERCSAARWCTLARAEIARAHAAGRLPILVGGTGLYFKALLHGLAPVPPIPQAVRDAARALHARLGAARFHAALAARDPAMAARLSPTNTQRVLRAYEVIEATGRSLAAWQEAPHERYGGPVETLIVEPPRAELYAACERRWAAITEGGGIAEVEALLARGLDPALPVMKALGVREIAQYLAGAITREEASRRAMQATRRYAKRQSTWFRHQMAGATRICPLDDQDLRDQALALVERVLLTAQGRETTLHDLM